MNKTQLIIPAKNMCKDGKNGYKVIEFNVSDPSENLFAVVTPVKKQ
ncbi:hypothetical protein [Bacillus salipaludis]|uniref:Uncharacterized protein n=1 Tax=Bacillus salipaludis TaxID=2547811 RepID=A0AA90TTI6_9BACI|nr:hypothetical protein [Bacillus salipaludis]MDQ6597719.1 hypothetical protein [Bacillus salipaludis]